jgi:hypothetical protein
MNTTIWVFQAVLATMMLLAGVFKLISNNAELIEKGNGRMDWAEDLSEGSVTMIGVVEFLIGLGLILPQLLDILPWLTPLAAIGAVLTMLGALGLHLKRKDNFKSFAINMIILSFAVFIAYGRFGLFPL